MTAAAYLAGLSGASAAAEPLAERVRLMCEGASPRVTPEFCSMEPGVVRLQGPDGAVVEVEALVAANRRTREAGYQFIAKDVIDQSAIFFVFERATRTSFHMCNVLAPLEIIWFRENGTILDALTMLPGAVQNPIRCTQLYEPRRFGTYRYALELPEGSLERLGIDDIGEWRLVDWKLGLPAPVAVSLAPVVGGLSQPVHVLQAPGDDATLYVVESAGRIRAAREGRLLSQPVLDISGSISRGGERGLLGAAFHPKFSDNGWLFVNFTDARGDTQIVRYTVDRETGVVDPDSRRTVLSIAQPASNHNGGMLAFGPDGYLYIGTGDGGRAGDPWGNAQNLGTLLGKMLRIDVDKGEPYAVPADNPMREVPGARPEIWAYGLRNPWRFSFDRETGDLYIADVGQGAWEEVNVQPAGSPGGENYGWNIAEGAHCYPAGRPCDLEGFALPVAEYSHGSGGGCAVVGGYVYRGSAIRGLEGRYVFGDYCTGTIWTVPAGAHGSSSREPEVLLESGFRISGFGEDNDGELYVIAYTQGVVYKLVPAGSGA